MARPYSRLGSSKPRRDSERQIKLDLESLVSQITRLRTPHCVLCGENNWRVLECGHFWHRAMPPTEFDLQNLNTLCRDCNRRHESCPLTKLAVKLENGNTWWYEIEDCSAIRREDCPPWLQRVLKKDSTISVRALTRHMKDQGVQ